MNRTVLKALNKTLLSCHKSTLNRRWYSICYSTADFDIPTSTLKKWKLLPQFLLEKQIVSKSEISYPPAIDVDAVKRVHCSDYVDRFLNGQMTDDEMKKIGMKYSEELKKRIIHTTGATTQAAISVMKGNASCAANLAGGAHHAFFSHGGGYCVWNDIVVAAEYLISQQIISSYLVIDLDTHQGDGTASLCHAKGHAYTFSMHASGNYPLKKQTSSWDIALPNNTDDETYLSILKDALTVIRMKRWHMMNYDIVFYQAGVDVLKGDRYGKLNLSIEGCRKRDELVFSFCKRENVPCVVTMGGGYVSNSNPIDRVLSAHSQTISMMKQIMES